MCHNPDRIYAAAEAILLASRAPGLAVAVCRLGCEDYIQGFGYTDVVHGSPVRGDTGFRIGSVTKTFTAMALAILREAGLLHWDDSVEYHLPYFRLEESSVGGKLRLRDVLSHQAGFGWHDPLWYNSPWDRTTILRRVRRVLTSGNCSRFHYSNLGFMLAGEVLAYAAARDYEEFVCQCVLQAIGMDNSGFGLRAKMAVGHDLLCSGHLAPVGSIDLQKANPACGLTSSAEDLALWLHFLLSSGATRRQRMLGVNSIWQLFEPQVEIHRGDDGRLFSYFPRTEHLHYCLGWFRSCHRNRTVLSHTGSLPGYRAHLALVPEAGLGVVALANLSHTWAPDAMVYTVIDEALGVSDCDWLEHFRRNHKQPVNQGQPPLNHYETPGSDPRPYCGSYGNRAYGNVTVGRDSERLTFEWTNYRSRMRATGADKFLLEDLHCPLLADNREVQFQRLATGEVEGLEFVETRFQRLN